MNDGALDSFCEGNLREEHSQQLCIICRRKASRKTSRAGKCGACVKFYQRNVAVQDSLICVDGKGRCSVEWTAGTRVCSSCRFKAIASHMLSNNQHQQQQKNPSSNNFGQHHQTSSSGNTIISGQVPCNESESSEASREANTQLVSYVRQPSDRSAQFKEFLVRDSANAKTHLTGLNNLANLISENHVLPDERCALTWMTQNIGLPSTRSCLRFVQNLPAFCYLSMAARCQRFSESLHTIAVLQRLDRFGDDLTSVLLFGPNPAMRAQLAAYFPPFKEADIEMSAIVRNLAVIQPSHIELSVLQAYVFFNDIHRTSPDQTILKNMSNWFQATLVGLCTSASDSNQALERVQLLTTAAHKLCETSVKLGQQYSAMCVAKPHLIDCRVIREMTAIVQNLSRVEYPHPLLNTKRTVEKEKVFRILALL